MSNPEELIDEMIARTSDWRGPAFGNLRRIVHEADPEIAEEVKWRRPSNPTGAPVFEHAGIVCTGAFLKGRVRLTFASGASLEDPAGLFNAALEGNKMRAIDFHEGVKVDERALKALVRAAVEQNLARVQRTRKSPPALSPDEAAEFMSDLDASSAPSWGMSYNVREK